MVEQLAGRGSAAEFVAHAAVGFDDGRAGVGHEAQHQFLGLDFEVEQAAFGEIRSAAFEEFFQVRPGRGLVAERKQVGEAAGEDAVIADEVDDFQPQLVFRGAEAPAELLEEDDLGFGGAQHDHAVHIRDVEAFVEEIDHAEGLEFAIDEIGEAVAARIAAGAGEHGGGADLAAAEPVAGVERVAAGAAEDERAGIGIGLPCGPQAFHALAVFEFLLQRGGIEAAVAPRDLLEVHIVLEPEIVEGNQRAFRDAIADGGLPRQHVVEERCHVHAIGALRGGGEAEGEGGIQPGHDPPVAGGLGVVDFVDDDVVEVLAIQLGEAFGAGEFLDRGDDEIAAHVAVRAEIPSDAGFLPFRLHGGADGGLGLDQDFGAVGDDQDAGLPIE